MASPQLGDGFTRISNELLEAIYSTDLNGTQFKIILLIIRSTYGFQKKAYDISVSFISSGIGIESRQLRRELNSLIEMNVVYVQKEATFSTPRMLGINKNHDEWCIKRPQRVNKTTGGEFPHSTEGENTLSTEGENTPQKRKEKESIKKEQKQNSISESNRQFEEVWKLYPRKLGKAIAMKKLPSLINQYGYEQMIRTVTRYKAEVKGKDVQFIQHGKTFFTSGFMDYLDKDDSKQTTKPDQDKPKPKPKAISYDEKIKELSERR